MNQKLKDLQSKWYKKLAKDGFVDIEDTSRDIPVLKKWSADIFRGKTQGEIDSRLEYYRSARALIYIYEFNSELDKIIWTLHAEGMSQRDIAEKLKRRKGCGKTSIDKIIRRIRQAASALNLFAGDYSE